MAGPRLHKIGSGWSLTLTPRQSDHCLLHCVPGQIMELDTLKFTPTLLCFIETGNFLLTPPQLPLPWDGNNLLPQVAGSPVRRL